MRFQFLAQLLFCLLLYIIIIVLKYCQCYCDANTLLVSLLDRNIGLEWAVSTVCYLWWCEEIATIKFNIDIFNFIWWTGIKLFVKILGCLGLFNVILNVATIEPLDLIADMLWQLYKTWCSWRSWLCEPLECKICCLLIFVVVDIVSLNLMSIYYSLVQHNYLWFD